MEEKMTGAMLDDTYRSKLAKILEVNKRKFKAQLQVWIDEETRIIARSGK